MKLYMTKAAFGENAIRYTKRTRFSYVRFVIIVLHTFIAVADRKEIHVVVFVVEKQQADPRVKRVNRHDEQYPDDPSLFRRVRVPSEVVVYLKTQSKKKMTTTQFYRELFFLNTQLYIFRQ